jgi:hypothetical protein
MATPGYSWDDGVVVRKLFLGAYPWLFLGGWGFGLNWLLWPYRVQFYLKVDLERGKGLFKGLPRTGNTAFCRKNNKSSRVSWQSFLA